MSLPDLQAYAAIARPETIDQIQQLARPLKGLRIVHVNSTRQGGGVAEILSRQVPLKQSLGIDARWEVIDGDTGFFQCTKGFHNALQGERVDIAPSHLRHYEEVNAANAERLRPILEEADFVFIHDPQPAGLIRHFPERRGKWVWRCHIDVSRPHRPVWRYLREIVGTFDASIFSLAAFAQPLPHLQFLVPPSIDPLSEKNIDLEEHEVKRTLEQYGLDAGRPMIVQISRFDRFKDPLGVIRAYQLARRHCPIQLVLAGGPADDDPEGAVMLDEVREAAQGDSDIHILLLPPDAHRQVNALQRAATLVVQKSLKEGFGLTVTEALWKRRPVIGGEVGGITLQVVDHQTGFLVNTPEGAAYWIRYLLNNPRLIAEMGERGREYVREHFLLTRHLRDYLTILVALQHPEQDRIELS